MEELGLFVRLGGYLVGGSLPLRLHTVAAYPLCGDTLQRPVFIRAEGNAHKLRRGCCFMQMPIKSHPPLY